MKKAVIIGACLIAALILLCGCMAEEQNTMETKSTKSASDKSVTVVNEVTEADFWILPQTEENQKTTLWGTATASKVKTGESRTAGLCEGGDMGLYLIRMIDADGFYYSVNCVAIENGWSVTIKENGAMSALAEVTDENGTPQSTYEVFVARL